MKYFADWLTIRSIPGSLVPLVRDRIFRKYNAIWHQHTVNGMSRWPRQIVINHVLSNIWRQAYNALNGEFP